MARVESRRSIALAAALVALAAAGPSGRAAELAVQGRSNANASIAALGSFVAVTWGATAKDGTDIYAASSRDGGRTFGPPARVSDAQSLASLSGEQPPRVTLSPRAGQEPSIAVVWTARQPAGTRLLSAQSVDGGKSFGRSAPLPGSGAAGNRGWESTTTDREGRVVAVWLDHRELAMPAGGSAPANHSGHEHGAASPQQRDGVARAQLSKLYFARLGSAESAREITGGVCYCCKTAVAAGAGGAIYAAWRHVYPGNIRDIAFTMTRDGGRTFAPPVRVSEDRWVLDGCPENGPSMAVDAAGAIHIVWPTLVAGPRPESEPTPALFYATSRDGRRFTPRQQIPTVGFPRHPPIALGPRGPVVAWDEQGSGPRRVAVGRGTSDGKGGVRFVRQAITDPQSATYPVLAATSDGVVAAWTSGSAGQTVLRTERLSE